MSSAPPLIGPAQFRQRETRPAANCARRWLLADDVSALRVRSQKVTRAPTNHHAPPLPLPLSLPPSLSLPLPLPPSFPPPSPRLARRAPASRQNSRIAAAVGVPLDDFNAMEMVRGCAACAPSVACGGTRPASAPRSRSVALSQHHHRERADDHCAHRQGSAPAAGLVVAMEGAAGPAAR